MMKWVMPFLFAAKFALGAELTLLSSYVWNMPNDAFGGFSSLHISHQGDEFLATSDHGHFLSGKIIRRDGKIVGISNQKIVPIQTPKGKPVSKTSVDAEGIAVRYDGKIYVSFERKHRVWAYKGTTAKAQKLPKHADFKKLQNNSGLEALAIDAKGWLYALPERSGKRERPFPVYRYNGKAWDKRLTIPRRGAFLVAGADFGPDGKFYLLERHHKNITGIATRIRRFTPTFAGFIEEQVLLETRFGGLDNLEGISVWRDDQNRIRISLISDDNFNLFLRTKLVEYVID